VSNVDDGKDFDENINIVFDENDSASVASDLVMEVTAPRSMDETLDGSDDIDRAMP
jgi:hypothetical protein